MLRTDAPAKIILFGEHAVVYGQPALAVPVSSLRASTTITPGNGLKIIAADSNETLPVDMTTADVEHALIVMARLVLDFLAIPPPDVTITLTSKIPLGSGLGSGAAVAAAVGRALAVAVNHAISDEDLNRLVYEVERLHHGTPSGIDNTVIVYEKPVYFVRERPIELLSIGKPLFVLIADTGRTALTRVAVGDVRKLYEEQPQEIEPVILSIGTIAQKARQALESGDLQTLGNLANQNHRLLQRLTVSSFELDALVQAACDAGALGAKLSGGGRGGNMIALVTEETVSTVHDALLKAGAVRVIKTIVE
jgi:mevalonate kinase